jgi:hypothetical protein
MIEKNGLENKNQELSYEVSVGVTFASFMGAVTIFFSGVLIASFKTFDSTIKIPLLFLIISTFSFIFSATIYSNAGSEITQHNFKKVQKYLIYANNILEFLGLYLFLVATPMVIGAVTGNNFLRLSTVLVALIGIFLYSQSDFSILNKELKNKRVKLFLSILIIFFGICLYFSQKMAQVYKFFGYDYVATFLLILMIIITVYFCSKSKQYSENN